MSILGKISVAIVLLLSLPYSTLAQQSAPVMLSKDAVLLDGLAGISRTEWLRVLDKLKKLVLSGESVSEPYNKITSLEGYRYQLMIVEYKEKPAIVLSGMCKEIKGWKENYIMTIDGGKCYFTIIYDRHSQNVIHYFINSEA